jgi:CubicO group peptidase (beta-lactamase class C family)
MGVATGTGAAPDGARMLSGGGGLIGTPYDYHRFTQMIPNGGEPDGVRLLSPRTGAYMTRNHIPDGQDLESFGRPLDAGTPPVERATLLFFTQLLSPAYPIRPFLRQLVNQPIVA